ncbi:T9SS type A sorting domain-containing protein [Hymenobacter weizhouensis]|uniref:T9SS type A sorting domain-containing protein n=1 Tax=Hymenobacter sp. YIM 151500-1 TaxID=2987689 RepID=UPI002225F39C|nr:T9SS type A sorting domain-containing protein [Hymenobacter sp. YIM 151500-1]UYZ64510.1 T9SS type A sorting domain-containing protein [Hymenobacter sp. YIM 151500-1]
MPFSLDVPTARAQLGSPDFRRAYIDVVPQSDGTYQITVRIQRGNTVTTAISKVTVPKPPPNLRIGFSGSTGGSTNVHEIRNLAILQRPFADDDLATTLFNQPVSLNVISNDVFPGSNFNPGTVDLDPFTAGIQSTLTLSGRGTFSASSGGVVTFTPSGTFAGVISIPYSVKNTLNDDPALSAENQQNVSNPANITVIVRGADLATSVTGPSSATTGSTITYTVSTANLGTEPATNVAPTIQLPTGLTNVTVSSGSYNSGTGLVTFGTVSSLAPSASPISNTVSFTAPSPRLLTAPASATTPTPDPVATNNTATISTIIGQLPNPAEVCATPGKDGPGALSTTGTQPNTYFPGVSVANDRRSIVLNAGTGATAIAAGDLLLVMQMQGADINSTNSSAYGSGGSGGSGNLTSNYTAGTYEYAVAANAVTVAGTNKTLQLANPLTNTYVNQDFTTGNGQRRFQVIRIPQYSSLTVSGAVTGLAWNGTVGGVLAVDVAGQTTFSASSILDMNGKGFRGGGGVDYDGNNSYGINDFRNLASNNKQAAHGSKGEGIAGTPRYINIDGTSTDTNVEGYPGGSVGQGAPGNAGGGGTDAFPTGSNGGNTGGGGGGNGGNGGNGGGYNTSATGGKPGTAAASAAAGRIFLGGGGGAGSANSNSAEASSGADGGGIIILRTGLVSGSGIIRANGDAALNLTANDEGAGGGGAGGTVLIAAQNPTGLTNLVVEANGGRGGNARTNTNDIYGGGGGGGGGLIYSNGNISTSSVAGAGTNGTSSNGTANGTTAGTAGTVNRNASLPAGIAGAGDCLPTLTVDLKTTTPTVQRTGADGTPVNPALYTMTLFNTGGQASNVSPLVNLTSNIFQFDGTFTPEVVLTLANGTTTTAPAGFANPTSGVSLLSFGSFTMPAGARLTVTFRATIAASAQNNLAYQASAAVTYLNPLRTTASGTIQPGQNYAGGTDNSLGAAGGSNYTASSSTAEDVTIARPLPVTLTAFAVAASGQDAKLTWSTAQELNNDRFEVERSLDGASFERVGSVQGKGTTSVASTYTYVDAKAGRLSLKPIYYRLRQVDLDGTFSYSPVRTVRFERPAKMSIALYPNPHTGRATLDLTALPAGEYVVDITDLAGRHVQQLRVTGASENPLALTKLPLGTYFVRVHNNQVNLTLPMVRN